MEWIILQPRRDLGLVISTSQNGSCEGTGKMSFSSYLKVVPWEVEGKLNSHCGIQMKKLLG